MKEVYKILELDKYQLGIIINALNDLRNKLIQEQRETDAVDEVLLKALESPQKVIEKGFSIYFGKSFIILGNPPLIDGAINKAIQITGITPNI